ncbi:hypothetical protein ACM7ZU_12370 [Pseudomonas aeruginosa]
MSEYQKQIKHHHSEIEKLTALLPDLLQAKREALKKHSMSGLNMAPYPHSEVSAYSRVESKIDSHKDAIKRLTPLLAWEEGVKNSPTTIKASRKIIEDSKAEQRKLEVRRDKLTNKRTSLMNDLAKQRTAATNAEREAAQRYASAMAGDDSDAERQAESLFTKASQALAALSSKGSSTAVIEALDAEIEAIDQELCRVKEKQVKAERCLLEAARYQWSVKLDHASKELAQIAGHVIAAEKALGWRSSSLSEFNLPLMAPGGAKYLGERHLAEISSGIGVEQLLRA